MALITATIRGLSTEVPVGVENHLDGPCVVSCDDVQTIPTADLEAWIGGFCSSIKSAPSAKRSARR